MKKILTLMAATLFAAGSFAASYGILVNGKTYYEGTHTDDFEGFTQYLAHVQVKSGDYCQLYDAENKATWAVDLNTNSVSGFTRDGDKYNVTTDGCYDFYIKLKFGADELYIGSGSDCGSGQDISGTDPGTNPGTNPGGSVEGNPRYYYKGYIDGEDVEPSEATLFDHGVAEIEFTQQAALFVLYQVDGFPGVQYMTSTWVDGPRHATLATTGGNEKWNCPAGTTKLYLYENGDGTLEISADPIAGKKLADPQPISAVEKTTVNATIQKVVENGQVIVIKDGVRYNLLGAQLQ